MAVYTKITSKDVLSLGNYYKIGKIIKSEGIKKGIENTNYLLKTSKQKFILTLISIIKIVLTLEKILQNFIKSLPK